MKAVKVLKANFLRPVDFSLSDHLRGRFGVWHSPEDKRKSHRVVLRYTGWAAHMVSERHWHPCQETKWLGKKEDVLEMVLELSGFEEISRWVLSWGPQVYVIEPESLREVIRNSIGQNQALYS